MSQTKQEGKTIMKDVPGLVVQKKKDVPGLDGGQDTKIVQWHEQH